MGRISGTMAAMASAGSGGDAGDNAWAAGRVAGMLKMVMVRTSDEVRAGGELTSFASPYIPKICSI